VLVAWKWALGGAVALVGLLVGRRAYASVTHVPARAMTASEALAAVYEYARKGQVLVLDESNTADGVRLTVGGQISGVQHYYWDGSKRTLRGSIDNLDPRFAVYLIRLDQLLHRMGIRELDDLGISHGSNNLGDVHNQGRAIDIAGLRGFYDRNDIDLNVTRDWGQRPEGESGTYRLGPGDPGYEEFRKIYDFAVREGSDRSEHADQGGPPSEIGFASYAITPDHPSPSLHGAHQNHMHLQVGRTQGIEEPDWS
jgi:hypothetical protein